jgi:hypothetical protein
VIVPRYLILLVKLATLLAFVAFMVYRHRIAARLTDPVVDLLLFIGGGLLTALLTILGGHVATTNLVYRWVFYVGGSALAAIIVATGIRNYNAAIAAKTPEQIVMKAVAEANDHTDKAIGMANQHTDTEVKIVRDDLKEVTEHSDHQTDAVRKDVLATANSLSSSLSKSTENLGKRIDAMKPPPPELAVLTFSYFTNDTREFPSIIRPLAAASAGSFTIDFMAKNISAVQATGSELWVQICMTCTYSKEPDGFTKITGSDERVRWKRFGNLNPGSYMPRMSIEVKLPTEHIEWFETAFDYSCANCGVVAPWSQTIRTTVFH